MLSLSKYNEIYHLNWEVSTRYSYVIALLHYIKISSMNVMKTFLSSLQMIHSY